MPKRWKLVAGGSYSWRYVETDTAGNVLKVLAQSNETWPDKKGAKDEIKAMKKNDDIDDSVP
jgi:hypothetical protein